MADRRRAGAPSKREGRFSGLSGHLNYRTDAFCSSACCIHFQNFARTLCNRHCEKLRHFHSFLLDAVEVTLTIFWLMRTLISRPDPFCLSRRRPPHRGARRDKGGPVPQRCYVIVMQRWSCTRSPSCQFFRASARVVFLLFKIIDYRLGPPFSPSAFPFLTLAMTRQIRLHSLFQPVFLVCDKPL